MKLPAREWMRKKWAPDRLIPSFMSSEDIIRGRQAPRRPSGLTLWEQGKTNLCNSDIIPGAECKNLPLGGTDTGLIGVKHYYLVPEGQKGPNVRREI